MYERIISLIGEEKLNKIRDIKVIVFGLGGVGGICTESLVRSGIEKITIVDGDIVSESNLNRQIIATRGAIGRGKCLTMKERIMSINNNIDIQIIDRRILPEEIDTLNLKQYDYIIDAIDDVKVKEELIKYSLENNLKIITSCGTAKKLEPEKLHITTLDKTSYDPLAKKLRTDLKHYNLHKVKVVSSTEEPIKTQELGSMMFVPSVAGLLIANCIIRDIIK